MYVQNGEIYEGPEERPVHLDNHTLNLIQRIPFERRRWDLIMDGEYACGREQYEEQEMELPYDQWKYGGERYTFEDCIVYLVNHEEENLFRDNPLLQRLSCMDCQIILGEQLEAMRPEDITRLAHSGIGGAKDWSLFRGLADVPRTARPCTRGYLNHSENLRKQVTARRHIPGDSREYHSLAWNTDPGPLVHYGNGDTTGLRLLDPEDLRARVCRKG